MTEEELKAIRERCDKATPGPWSFNEDDPNDGLDGAPVFSVGYDNVLRPRIATVRSVTSDILRDNCNAAFIAHARSDVPMLLDEVERLRNELGCGK